MGNYNSLRGEIGVIGRARFGRQSLHRIALLPKLGHDRFRSCETNIEREPG
jgi:hypothetical protein